MKAFKIITSFNHFDAMYNLNNWPQNVLIKRFGYSRKNNMVSEKENIKTTHNNYDNFPIEIMDINPNLNTNCTAN